MKALVDCNNFFVSCERLFDPKLADKPVAVLSSNDGCVVARSNEVKALGVPMGVPVFKVRELLRQHRVVTRSSNFALYGDLSRRVMATLWQFAHDLEVYSVDEAFLEIDGLREYEGWARQIRKVVQRDTGIPVSVGVAPTRTLAKAAATLAKRNNGVLSFAGKEAEVDNHLQTLAVGDVWGVGRQLACYFAGCRVRTAYGLKYLPEPLLEGHNVTVRRMVLELRGIAADTPGHKHSQSMISTRSFQQPLFNPSELGQALNTHAAHLGIKLRREALATSLVVAMLSTGKGGVYRQASAKLPVATNDSRRLIQTVQGLLPEIYRTGLNYKKAGVMVYRLVPASAVQLTFGTNPADLDAAGTFNQLLDSVNAKWGARTLKLAAEGLEQTWQAKHIHRSPRYTTDWSELKVVV